MNRMPCRISDDPYSDYSDFIEQEGVYKQYIEFNPDDERDAQLDRQFILNTSLEPLITPHVGDKIIER